MFVYACTRHCPTPLHSGCILHTPQSCMLPEVTLRSHVALRSHASPQRNAAQAQPLCSNIFSQAPELTIVEGPAVYSPPRNDKDGAEGTDGEERAEREEGKEGKEGEEREGRGEKGEETGQEREERASANADEEASRSAGEVSGADSMGGRQMEARLPHPAMAMAQGLVQHVRYHLARLPALPRS